MNKLIDRYLATVAAVALTACLLQGCAAVVAIQAVPVAISGVAMANAEDIDPFSIDAPQAPHRTDREFAMLDTQIRLAECGNAESQYWLGSALRNGFNENPDYVEIYKWYRLAEMGKFAPATKELAVLDATMSAPEISVARSRANAWRPATEGCSVSPPLRKRE